MSTDDHRLGAPSDPRLRVWPGLRIPDGLSFDDLVRGGEMIIDWGNGDMGDRGDDFRAVRLVAKLYEYLLAAASERSCSQPKTD